MSMSVAAPEYQVPADKVPAHVDRANATFCSCVDGGNVVTVAVGATATVPVHVRVSKFGELPANPVAPVTSPTAGVAAKLGDTVATAAHAETATPKRIQNEARRMLM